VETKRRENRGGKSKAARGADASRTSETRVPENTEGK
jgi:hypothetical protein